MNATFGKYMCLDCTLDANNLYLGFHKTWPLCHANKLLALTLIALSLSLSILTQGTNARPKDDGGHQGVINQHFQIVCERFRVGVQDMSGNVLQPTHIVRKS